MQIQGEVSKVFDAVEGQKVAIVLVERILGGARENKQVVAVDQWSGVMKGL